MNPSRLCQDQLVVDRDKGASHLVLADADEFSDNHKKRKKKPDHHPANFPVEEKVLTPEDGEHQGKPAADQKSNDQRENTGHDQGKHGMDVAETDVGDEPQSYGNHDQAAASQEKQEDEDPLLRLMVGFSFLCLFDPIG
jgi:hypothetical protein